MTEQDRAILRICAHTSVQILTGHIPLHPHTRKQVAGLKLNLMLIEETAVWSEDAD